MSRLGWLGAGLGALLVITALAVALLLFYYRPTIEYAYVDIIDKREHPISGAWVLAGFLTVVALVVGSFAWLARRLRRRDDTK